MVFYTKSESETILLGEAIGSFLQKGDILALQGTLGAGKTTLTKGIAKALKITDDVTSPTFCLISEYESPMTPLYHIDVYRLEGIEDFENLGAEDLLYGDGVCIIEWSEKIMSILPKRTIILTITPLSDGQRKIELKNWNYGVIEK